MIWRCIFESSISLLLVLTIAFNFGRRAIFPPFIRQFWICHLSICVLNFSSVDFRFVICQFAFLTWVFLAAMISFTFHPSILDLSSVNLQILNSGFLAAMISNFQSFGARFRTEVNFWRKAPFHSKAFNPVCAISTFSVYHYFVLLNLHFEKLKLNLSNFWSFQHPWLLPTGHSARLGENIFLT